MPVGDSPVSETLGQTYLSSEDFDASQFHVLSIEGVERISQPFHFELSVVDIGHNALDLDGSDASDRALSIDDIVGAKVTIRLTDMQGDEVREVHGMVWEVDNDLDPVVEDATFRLRVVPRFYQASLVKLTEVYLAMSIPDIVQEKLDRLGLGSAVAFRLNETYDAREFVTQYEETDLDFINRITEHLGISYFFEHDGGEDRIVFTDHVGGFAEASDKKVAVNDSGDERDIYGLRLVQKIVPKRYIHHDYNYRKPEVELLEQHEASDGLAGGHAEYGGHARTPAEASHLARVRKERQEATRRVYRAHSDLSRLQAGYVFAFDDHPRVDGTEILITEVHHRGRHPRSFAGGAETATYENQFVASPADRVFRPEVRTPRPKIHGVLTGVIDPDATTGMGKYAKLDDEGRYTVRFTFDTAPYGEQKFSHPVRRAQPYGGNNEGMHFPLKPGVEVCLAFTNGDPDRPVIVGALPNPVTPSVVNASEAQLNRIRTANGIKIEFGRVGG